MGSAWRPEDERMLELQELASERTPPAAVYAHIHHLIRAGALVSMTDSNSCAWYSAVLEWPDLSTELT
jgi:hypothetical protein